MNINRIETEHFQQRLRERQLLSRLELVKKAVLNPEKRISQAHKNQPDTYVHQVADINVIIHRQKHTDWQATDTILTVYTQG